MAPTSVRRLLVWSRLAFPDPSLEENFLAFYDGHYRRQGQVAMLLAMVMALVFLPQDAQIDPLRGPAASLVRVFFLAPVFLGYVVLSVIPRLRPYNQAMLSLACCGGVLGILAVLYFLDNDKGFGLSSSMALSNVTLSIIFIFSMTSLRFLPAALTAAVAVAMYYLAVTGFTEVEHDYFVNGDFSNVLFVMLIGGFIGVTRELYIRRNYLLQLKLEERFRDLVEGSIQGVLIHREFRPIFANQAWAEIFGFGSPGEVLRLPSVETLYAASERRRIAEYNRALLAGEEAPFHYECQGERRDGRMIWLDCVVRVVGWQGAPAIQCTVVDVTARKQVEEDLRKLSQAVEQSPASVMITGIDGRIEYVNPKFIELTGYALDEVLGKEPGFLRSGYTSERRYRERDEIVRSGGEWRGEQHSRKKSGELFWEYVLVSPIKTADGEVSHFLTVSEDITIRKEYEDRLLHQANYDDLTDLPNRVLLMDRLSRAVAAARRHGRMMGLMLIDLDRFKAVNDRLGHVVGDDLLREAAERLSVCMREGDTVARLGGDEFAAVLADLSAVSDAELVANRILDALSAPFVLEGQEIFCTASIGTTIGPTDGVDPQVLMRNADAAMYRVKEIGRNGFQFFTPEMNAEAVRRSHVETHLRHALERQELSLHYQPLVDLASGEIAGAEALLRWHSPELGEVPPSAFIPLAEDTGLIVPIGDWVLREACKQVRLWRESGRGPRHVAVNVSSRQFRDGNLHHLIGEILDETGVPPEALELELTESLLLDESSGAGETLKLLSALGVRLSVDDFGTGYSALSYLKRFPFSTLKIDHSFVRDVCDDAEDKVLIEAIVAMGHSLNLKVIAEGVETKAQADFLHSRRCDVIQGHYISRPLPSAQFDDLMTLKRAAFKGEATVEPIPVARARQLRG